MFFTSLLKFKTHVSVVNTSSLFVALSKGQGLYIFCQLQMFEQFQSAAELQGNKSSLGTKEADEGNLFEWEGWAHWALLLLAICKRATQTHTHRHVLGTGHMVVSIDVLGDGRFLPLKLIIFLRALT